MNVEDAGIPVKGLDPCVGWRGGCTWRKIRLQVAFAFAAVVLLKPLGVTHVLSASHMCCMSTS